MTIIILSPWSEKSLHKLGKSGINGRRQRRKITYLLEPGLAVTMENTMNFMVRKCFDPLVNARRSGNSWLRILYTLWRTVKFRKFSSCQNAGNDMTKLLH